MDWKTNTQLEITDLGDRLEMMVRTQKGLVEWIFIVVGVPAAVAAFTRTSQLLGIAIAFLLGFSLLNAFRKGNETRMIVCSYGFRVEGNIDRAFAESVEVSVDDIHGIGYFVGNEGDPSGLYALRSFSNTCLIPQIDKSQCEDVKAAIEAKFPDMKFGQQPSSGLFGKGPEVISLGLSRHGATNADKPNS